MDGTERRLVTTLARALFFGCSVFVMFIACAQANDEELDLEFLEWLGQTAEIEELGVDIDNLLLAKEQASLPAENGEAKE